TYRMHIELEAKSTIFLGDDHAEEFLAIDEVPGLGWQVAPFPIDLPVVEHRAELVNRAAEEGVFFCRQRRRCIAEQFRPVGIAGKEIGIPPDVAGLQCLALGIRHRRQYAACPGKDRLGDEVAAEGAHGDVLFSWEATSAIPAFVMPKDDPL